MITNVFFFSKACYDIKAFKCFSQKCTVKKVGIEMQFQIENIHSFI